MQMAIKNRRTVPKQITEAPIVSDNNSLTWLCFWDLRRGSDPEKALKWADVLLWANTYSCSLPEMEGLQAGILVLDSAFLPVMRARAKAARDAAKPKGVK